MDLEKKQIEGELFKLLKVKFLERKAPYKTEIPIYMHEEDYEELKHGFSRKPYKPLSLVPQGGLSAVPPDRLKAMQEFALKLRKKYPQMKENRLMGKVAKEFKVKLV